METSYSSLRFAIERQKCRWLAVGWHLAARVGLKALPFSVLLDRLSRRSSRTRANDATWARLSFDSVLQTSKSIGHRLPGGPDCLADALAARGLLARYGHSTRLRVGARRSDDGTLAAHAWLERRGIPVLGGHESPEQFEPVPLSSIGSHP